MAPLYLSIDGIKLSFDVFFIWSSIFNYLVLDRLSERTGMTHGDVAVNTFRIVGKGDNTVSYVMDIPEYPWFFDLEGYLKDE